MLDEVAVNLNSDFHFFG